MGRAAGGRKLCSCVQHSRDAAPRQQAPRRAANRVAGDSGVHARETGIVRILAAGGLFRRPSTESGLRHALTAGIAPRACRSTRLAGRSGQPRSSSHLPHVAGVNVLMCSGAAERSVEQFPAPAAVPAEGIQRRGISSPARPAARDRLRPPRRMDTQRVEATSVTRDRRPCKTAPISSPSLLCLAMTLSVALLFSPGPKRD